MGTIGEKLTAMSNSKAAIRKSLESKNIEVGETPFSGYAALIDNMQSIEYLEYKEIHNRLWDIFNDIINKETIRANSDPTALYGSFLLLKADPRYKQINVADYIYPYRLNNLFSIWKSNGDIVDAPKLGVDIRIEFTTEYDITFNGEKYWWIAFIGVNSDPTKDRMLQTQFAFGRNTKALLVYNSASENTAQYSGIDIISYHDIDCLSGMNGTFTPGYKPDPYFAFRNLRPHYVYNIDFAAVGGSMDFGNSMDFGPVRLMATDIKLSNQNVDLTVEGMNNLINGLPQLAEGVTKSVTDIPTRIFTAIPPENITIATNKGWTLSMAKQ